MLGAYHLPSIFTSSIVSHRAITVLHVLLARQGAARSLQQHTAIGTSWPRPSVQSVLV